MDRFICQKCTKCFAHKRNLNRHKISHDDEQKYGCQTCNKGFFRADILTKHKLKCVSVNSHTCNLCSKTFSQKWNLKRHIKNCENKTVVNEIQRATMEYNNKLKRGEIIEQVLIQHRETREEALTSKDREALQLYQSICDKPIDMATVDLKPWQEEVMGFIERPDMRMVYWIVGKKGGEGKSFIQNILRSMYGTRRVFNTEINTRKVDIAYVLAQETLTCKDIFLFNLLRSDYTVAYGLLENIKDGYLMSSKYKSTTMKIKTPNVVIVFSNGFPDQTKLSVDRWKILEIRDNRLYTKPPRYC